MSQVLIETPMTHAFPCRLLTFCGPFDRYSISQF